MSDSRLGNAKRVFFANLALLAFLGTAYLLFIPEPDSDPTESDSSADPQKYANQPELSLMEMARISGQALALSAHPDTLPPYEEEWIRKQSENFVRRDRIFESVTDENQFSELANEFFEGYTDYFYEYFDDSPAIRAGYRYGLRFAPELHGPIAPPTQGTLDHHRNELEKRFGIKSKAAWYIFRRAFDMGFVSSYPKVEEGVTVSSKLERIPLIENID